MVNWQLVTSYWGPAMSSRWPAFGLLIRFTGLVIIERKVRYFITFFMALFNTHTNSP